MEHFRVRWHSIRGLSDRAERRAVRGRHARAMSGSIIVLVLGAMTAVASPAAASPAVAATPTVLAPGLSLAAQTQAVAQFAHAAGISDQQAEANISIQHQAGDIVGQLESALGTSYAGVWFNNQLGEFEVPILNSGGESAASHVFAGLGLGDAFGTTSAKYSWNELLTGQRSWNGWLEARFGSQQVYSTAIDTAANSVDVSLSSSLPAQVRASVAAAIAQHGSDARVEVVSPESLNVTADGCSFPNCGAPLRGGVQVTGPPYNCSGSVCYYSECTAGFIVHSLSNDLPYMLTAGHCFMTDSGTFRSGNWTATSSDTGNTYAIGAGWRATVSSSLTVMYENSPVQGEAECHEGRTSGNQCGVNVSPSTSANVTYPWGTINVSNLAEDNGCASPGDSGGPVMDIGNSYALGITIADSDGGCPNGPYSYNLMNNATIAMNSYVWLGS